MQPRRVCAAAAADEGMLHVLQVRWQAGPLHHRHPGRVGPGGGSPGAAAPPEPDAFLLPLHVERRSAWAATSMLSGSIAIMTNGVANAAICATAARACTNMLHSLRYCMDAGSIAWCSVCVSSNFRVESVMACLCDGLVQ